MTLRLDFDPQGFTEHVGDALGVVSSSVETSLETFKSFIEERGTAEGAWRGTIERGEPVAGATSALDIDTGTALPDSEGLDLRRPTSEPGS